MSKFYPESKVEIQGLTAKYYDHLLNVFSLGFYSRFIRKVISQLKIEQDDYILDLGCGTGRNAQLMNGYLNEKGFVLGIDVSESMGERFKKRFKNCTNAKFMHERIDLPLNCKERFDKVFISFVIHGFPNDIRKIIIDNAYKGLKRGGTFWILDFNEFSLKDMPFYYRIPFTKIECTYAFDFIERDWKKILKDSGFNNFSETPYLKSYVRLLRAEKK
jgi:ubiquinone/menaquinone biosynthesis C-methylase UbiE